MVIYLTAPRTFINDTKVSVQKSSSLSGDEYISHSSCDLKPSTFELDNDDRKCFDHRKEECSLRQRNIPRSTKCINQVTDIHFVLLLFFHLSRKAI